jgi:hypothetical protein
MAKAKFIQGLEPTIRNGERRSVPVIIQEPIIVPLQVWLSTLPYDTTVDCSSEGAITFPHEGDRGFLSGPAFLWIDPNTREVHYSNPPNCPTQRPCWSNVSLTDIF